MTLRRRDFLWAGVVLGAVFGGPPLWRRMFPSFDFVPLDGFPGFRKLDQGPVSSGPIAFLGLERSDDDLRAEQARIMAAPCQSIFGPPDNEDSRTPVAVFTDYNCPYCRILTEQLITLAESGVPIRLIWYELPLLGPRSERSAKAALAADIQGKYIAAHRYLMRRVLPPGPVGFRRMARDLDLDAVQLAYDAGSNTVAERLSKAQALAGVLGVIGTPTTLIGKTMVVGSIENSDLDNLIALERSLPAAYCD